MAGKKGTGKSRKAAAPRWTAAAEEAFFAELAAVCNVAAAARAAGFEDTRKVYGRRRGEPEFRRRWEEAIAESYAMLELEMLERGRLGADRPPPANAIEARQREIPSSLALQLLKMHQGRMRALAPGAMRPMRGEKLRDELAARLAEIARRLGGE